MSDEIERMMDDPRSVLPAGIDSKADKMTAEEFRDIRDFRISKISLQRLARVMANDYGLNQALVCALCEVESSWIPWAVRHEDGYRWLWGAKRRELFDETPTHEFMEMKNRLGIELKTEKFCQQTSWGLCQIMGAVARERGYRGWLTELCDPATNLEWGCRHLRWMIEHAGDYGIEMIGNSPGAFGQHTPPAHTVYQSFDPDLADLAAAWNGGKVRIVDGKYVNEDYVKRVVRAMANYQTGG